MGLSLLDLGCTSLHSSKLREVLSKSKVLEMSYLEITTSFLPFPLDDEALGDLKLCHSTPIH
jgi:hypothetical protein